MLLMARMLLGSRVDKHLSMKTRTDFDDFAGMILQNLHVGGSYKRSQERCHKSFYIILIASPRAAFARPCVERLNKHSGLMRDKLLILACESPWVWAKSRMLTAAQSSLCTTSNPWIRIENFQ